MSEYRQMEVGVPDERTRLVSGGRVGQAELMAGGRVWPAGG